ncbi:MAG: major facilitator superfamily transporter [Patescibacteria group bacterium]|nr:major facilitator superfamily transporter [Patescibacteria group bacterium]
MKHRQLLRTTYWAGFLFSLHVALTVFVNSSFLSTRISDSLVGLFYAASAIVGIAGLYLVPKLINWFGTSRVLGFLMLANIVNLFVFGAVSNPYIIGASFILFFAFNTLLYLGIDIIVERFSENSAQGDVRGSYLTMMNLGYVLAPLLGGFILDRLGFSALYGFAVVILVPVIIVISFQLPTIRTTHPSKENILELAKKFMQHKRFRLAFFVNFILQFFYAWMVIYTPIYLHEIAHIAWDTIGIIFAIMLTAFVILEYPLGKIADKIHIEKHLMIIGLFIMGFATLFVARAPSISILSLTLILLVTRVGASMVEVATESYFFKSVHHDDTGSIGFFRNTYPFAYILAPLIASLVLKFAPLKALFPILGVICFLGILIAGRIRKVK